MSKEKKQYLVFGGTGAIGSALCEELHRREMHPLAISRQIRRARLNAGIRGWQCDVTSAEDIRYLAAHEGHRTQAIIYSAGNCPPNGFAQVTSTPMSQAGGLLQQDMQVHAYGLVRVLEHFGPLLAPDGAIVVVGSAITRFAHNPKTLATLPENTHPFHYVAAKAAQEAVVLGARRDPSIRVPIHLVRPGAVDTPFHKDRPAVPRLAVTEVVASILTCLEATEGQDITLLPQAA